MTEGQWLSCTAVGELLSAAGGLLTPRKKGWFLVGLARRVLHLARDGRSVAAIEVLERFLDGHAGAAELKAARTAARKASQEAEGAFQAACRDCIALIGAAGLADQRIDILNFTIPVEDEGIRTALSQAHRAGAARQATLVARRATEVKTVPATLTGPIAVALRTASWAAGVSADYQEVTTQEERAHCSLLRDVVGNSFEASNAQPSSRRASSNAILKLAQSGYEERRLPEGTLDPARLAVLADALGEAGCTDAEILGHLRGPGPHVRGCWAVDRIRGKE
jgi:hypothetical protein